MLYCAGCGSTLQHGNDALGPYWHCPACKGRAVKLAELPQPPHRALEEIWQAADAQTVGPPCPECAERMHELPLPGGEATGKAAACRSCALLWLDARATQTLLPPAPTPVVAHEEEELSPEVRAALLMTEMQSQAYLTRETWEPPDEIWKVILAILGYPVETDAPLTNLTIPWVTWGLAVMISAISLLVLYTAPEAIATFGFIPLKAARYAGLTALTAFFLHGSWFHLLGNIYVLLVFGKSVERHLGSGRYALLLLLATLAGNFAHYLANPANPLPCIGASGGIAGIMLAYAFFFPRARFAVCLIVLRFYWLRLPAYVIIAIWLVQQLGLASAQLAGNTSISAFSHLGGAIVGLLCWFRWRQQVGEVERPGLPLPASRR